MNTNTLAPAEVKAILSSVTTQFESVVPLRDGQIDCAYDFRPAGYCFTQQEIAELRRLFRTRESLPPYIVNRLRLSINGPYSQADIFNGGRTEFRAWIGGLVRLGFSITFA